MNGVCLEWRLSQSKVLQSGIAGCYGAAQRLLIGKLKAIGEIIIITIEENRLYVV